MAATETAVADGGVMGAAVTFGSAARCGGDGGCGGSMSSAMVLVTVGWGFGPIAPGFSPYFLAAHAFTGGDEALAGMTLEVRVAEAGGGVEGGIWEGGGAALGRARGVDCDEAIEKDGGMGLPK